MAVREAPIRVEIVECGDATRRIDRQAQAEQDAHVGSAVERELRIEGLFPPDVSAEPGDLLRKAAVDDRRGGRSTRERRRRIRKAPRGRAVPRVLHGGIVVYRRAVDPVRLGGACRRILAGGPDVHVVRYCGRQAFHRTVVEVVVAPLDESAEVVGDLAGEKQACAGKNEVAVALVHGHGIAAIGIHGLVVLGIGHGRLRHDGQRNVFQAPTKMRACRWCSRSA